MAQADIIKTKADTAGKFVTYTTLAAADDGLVDLFQNDMIILANPTGSPISGGITTHYEVDNVVLPNKLFTVPSSGQIWVGNLHVGYYRGPTNGLVYVNTNTDGLQVAVLSE